MTSKERCVEKSKAIVALANVGRPAEWKKELCCHGCTARAWQRRAAVPIHAPAPVLLLLTAASPPAGSAMSGLDGLIGAEERIINSKTKINGNTVRGNLSLRRRAFLPRSGPGLRAALWKREHSRTAAAGFCPLKYAKRDICLQVYRCSFCCWTHRCFHKAPPSSALNESDLPVTALS